MEPKPKGDVHQSQELELVADSYLKEGQNFFDQDPFQRIIETTSLNTHTEIDKLRRVLQGVLKVLTKELEPHQEFIFARRPSTPIEAALQLKNPGILNDATRNRPWIKNDERNNYKNA